MFIFYRVQHTSVPLGINPSFLNPQDTNLQLQVAMKNIQANNVFYFVVPLNLATLLVPTPPLEINNLVATWKSLDDSLGVSMILNGKIQNTKEINY